MTYKKQKIEIGKKVYGNKTLGALVDRSFKELVKQTPPPDLSKFFKMYEELFFDIPQQGNNSHTYLINSSKDYLTDYKDPKDDEINELNDQIIELEARIDELENPDEHQFYKNGTVISRGGGGNYYYMEAGKRRRLVGGRPGETWAALKQSMGYKESDDDFESKAVIKVSRNIVDKIPEGPYLDIEDIAGGKPKTVKEVKLKLDPSDRKANPDLYESVEDYKEALEKEINEAWNLEREIEQMYQKYNNQRRLGETEDDREEGRRMYRQTKKELDRVRIKLSKFKRIYEMIESGQNVTLTGVDNLYENLFEGDMKDSYLISKEEKAKFKGWENGAFGEIRRGVDPDTGEYYTFG
tara:strand:+ start:554 stop:1612 length:1059 start_codon:yes stop_codon:yes gene_type:complete